jgi:hypothetical protein
VARVRVRVRVSVRVRVRVRVRRCISRQLSLSRRAQSRPFCSELGLGLG